MSGCIILPPNATQLPDPTGTLRFFIRGGIIKLATAMTDFLHLVAEEQGILILFRTNIPTGVPPIRQRQLDLQAYRPIES